MNLRIALKQTNKNPVSRKEKVDRKGERARGREEEGGREAGKEQTADSRLF